MSGCRVTGQEMSGQRRTWRRGAQRPDTDSGSTIPLLLGFFLIALLVVAGSIAASDAFLGQRSVQSVCDGATLAAASAVDLSAVRAGRGQVDLPLAAVQQAAQTYLARDQARAGFTVTTTVAADGATVTARCSQRRPVALGRYLGLAGGVEHVASSSARTSVRR